MEDAGSARLYLSIPAAWFSHSLWAERMSPIWEAGGGPYPGSVFPFGDSVTNPRFPLLERNDLDFFSADLSSICDAREEREKAAIP